jgi:hypothetical protein
MNANKTFFFDPVNIDHQNCKQGKIVLKSGTGVSEIVSIGNGDYKVSLEEIDYKTGVPKSKSTKLKGIEHVKKVLNSFFKRKDSESKKLRMGRK